MAIADFRYRSLDYAGAARYYVTQLRPKYPALASAYAAILDDRPASGIGEISLMPDYRGHQHQNGWDWAEWGTKIESGQCPSLPLIYSKELQFYVNHSWKFVTESFGGAASFNWPCPGSQVHYAPKYYNWFIS